MKKTEGRKSRDTVLLRESCRESYSQNRRVLYPAVLWLLYGYGPIGRREIFLPSSLLVEIEGYFSFEFVNYVCETEDCCEGGQIVILNLTTIIKMAALLTIHGVTGRRLVSSI
jgi:hypothetical protein